MPRESCACTECIAACKTRPCWTMPEDAKRLIDAGYADRLMDDYWVGDQDIHLLCPAVVGYEGCEAPDMGFIHMFMAINPFGRCTFLDDKGLCELHKKELKPFEGRSSLPCEDSSDEMYKMHEKCAMAWDSEEGQALLKQWRASRQ